MPQISNVSEKTSKNESVYSLKAKLKSKEFAEELIVHKVSEMMHAGFKLKGEIKYIRCCPVNQLKLFDVQWVICR